MKRTILASIALAGVAGAFAVPTLAQGNARRTEGTLSSLQAAETPYIAELKGSNEFPGPGDTDGLGAATISFDDIEGDLTEVCFDLSYSGIGTPTLAHIHTGAAGVANPPLIDFQVPLVNAPTESSITGCVDAPTADADLVRADPAGFYVNIHTAEFGAGAIRGQLAEGPGSAGSMHFLPTPLRAYDSRISPATKLAADETRTISLANGKDNLNASFIAVPPGATAAIITLTATETGGPGFLTAYSADSPRPATSNLNYTVAGATVAVSTQVAVDASGQVKITAGPAATHFLIDVVGYLY